MTTKSGNPRRQARLYLFGERWKVDLAWFGRNDWRETTYRAASERLDERHGVSLRTIQRDMDIINLAGASVSHK